MYYGVATTFYINIITLEVNRWEMNLWIFFKIHCSAPLSRFSTSIYVYCIFYNYVLNSYQLCVPIVYMCITSNRSLLAAKYHETVVSFNFYVIVYVYICNNTSTRIGTCGKRVLRGVLLRLFLIWISQWILLNVIFSSIAHK